MICLKRFRSRRSSLISERAFLFSATSVANFLAAHRFQYLAATAERAHHVDARDGRQAQVHDDQAGRALLQSAQRLQTVAASRCP